MLTLASLPWTAALRAPTAPALLSDRGDLDFASLDRAAAGVAAHLERTGVRAGDRVGICCGNGLAFAPLYYGALRCAAVAVLLAPTTPVAALADAMRRHSVRVIASDEENAAAVAAACAAAATGAASLVLLDHAGAAGPALDSLVEHPSTAPKALPPQTPAVILTTSGTTGVPRAALHSHGGLMRNAGAVAGEMLDLTDRDVQLGALPMAHSFGMSAVLNASMLAGAAVALVHRFDTATALDVIERRNVSVLQAVPTMLARLSAAATTRPASLRRCVISGAPLPATLARQVHDRLCTTVIERYGMTEVSPLTMRLVPRHGGQPGDVGRPLRNVTIRIAGGAEEGELEASAPSMFLGYADDDGATRATLVDGFFRTGDLGTIDPDGRVRLTGRLKDLIIRGGHNVAAREVEHLLEGHPAVAEVAVVGLPDADLGEEVAAALVLRGGAAGGVADELRQRCIENLAAYKRPRRWFVVDELPRTASGKVRKGALREALGQADAVLVEPRADRHNAQAP